MIRANLHFFKRAKGGSNKLGGTDIDRTGEGSLSPDIVGTIRRVKRFLAHDLWHREFEAGNTTGSTILSCSFRWGTSTEHAHRKSVYLASLMAMEAGLILLERWTPWGSQW